MCISTRDGGHARWKRYDPRQESKPDRRFLEERYALFRHAVVGMATACSDLLSKADLKIDDVDVVVPHQANARIIAAVAKRLGVSDERLVVDVADVGNTSAASIPIALESTWRSGRLQPGSILLTVAFGAGLAWGANLIRWTAEPPSDQAAGLETG